MRVRKRRLVRLKSSVKYKSVKVVGRQRRFLRKSKELATINKILSTNIRNQMPLGNSPILEVDENGTVTNIDYNNPQHMKWMED